MSWQAMGLNLARPVDPRVVDPWCTPRVTANMFPQHSGRAVVLIGKVLETRSIDAATTGVYILCPVSGVEFMAQLHPDKLNELGPSALLPSAAEGTMSWRTGQGPRRRKGCYRCRRYPR